MSSNLSYSASARRSLSALFAILLLVGSGCSSDDDKGEKGGSLSQDDDDADGGREPAAGSGFGNAVDTAGISGGGQISGDAGPGSGSAGFGDGDGKTCAQGTANAHPVTPTVWLIVDGSSSMNTAFDASGPTSRWLTLRSTLMDKGGVVDTLQAGVHFGMVVYSGGNTDPNQCEKLVTVDPAAKNYAAIEAQYGDTPLGTGTPTDKALEYVVTSLPISNEQMLDADVNPVYVVLATDGAPNACDGSSMGSGPSGFDPIVAQRVVDAVTAGTKKGMKMFVISLAGSDTVLQTHLEDVATATKTGEAPFVPATKDELVSTFQKIISSATCRITLEGEVKAGEECKGKVELDGKALPCNSKNGWSMLDSHTVKLAGTACKTFLSKDSLVNASFPCGVFTPSLE